MTHYQELEWKLVSGHGRREELYQVGLGVFVQALIKAIYDDQSAKFLRKIITLACEELKGFKVKLCELHLNGICKDEGISLNRVHDELVGAGNDTSNTVGDPRVASDRKGECPPLFGTPVEVVETSWAGRCSSDIYRCMANEAGRRPPAYTALILFSLHTLDNMIVWSLFSFGKRQGVTAVCENVGTITTVGDIDNIEES